MAARKINKGKNSGTDSGKTVDDSSERSAFTPTAISQFLHEVFAEFKKIVWPAKKITAGLTCVVLVLVMFLSFFLGSVDLLLGKVVTFILNFGTI